MSEIITDDRRVVSYRLGRRIATAGDLREPITFVRSSRTPNTQGDNTEFVQSLSPYRNTWASVSLGEKKGLEGESIDPNAISVFTIRRDPDLVIEERDYVSYDDDLYRVISTKIVGIQKDFIEVRTTYFARQDATTFGQGGVVRAPATEPETPTADPNNASSVFWGQTT